MTDGNKEQRDEVAADIFKRVIAHMEESAPGRTFHVDNAFVTWLDKKIGDKIKIWAASILLAYTIPLGVGIWQLSEMNANFRHQLSDSSVNTASLIAKSDWQDQQEDFNCDVRRVLPKDAEIGPCRFPPRPDRTDPRR